MELPAAKGSSVSLRDTLEQVYKQTGNMPTFLADLPEQPEELAYLWHWFIDVKGSEPLNYTELKSWVDLTGNELAPWEADVIKALDRLYRRALRRD